MKTEGVVWRVFLLSKPEALVIFIGFVASLVCGLAWPGFSIVYSNMLSDLLTLTGEELKDSARFWAIGFLILGVSIGTATYFQKAMFGVSGEILTARVRRMLFKAILRQDIGWFDDKSNSTGVLTTKVPQNL